MRNVVVDVLSLVGNTPIVKLRRVTAGTNVTVLAKLEMLQLGGSIKGRAALSMIEALERAGKVTPDTTFIEASTGNQGIAVAMVCAAKGYKCIICIPELYGMERRKIMQAYGARVILTPTFDDMEKTVWTARRTAARLEQEIPNAIYLRQFDNPANPAAHRLGTAAEIVRDLGTEFDAFVATIGTGGTLSGVAELLKSVVPHVKVFGAEPAAAAREGQGTKGLHKQEGIGDAQEADFMPRHLIDGFVAVTDQEAFDMARRLAREEGILCGISSGTAVHAAIEVGKRLGPGTRVVTILPDTGERYLQGELYGPDYLGEPERRSDVG